MVSVSIRSRPPWSKLSRVGSFYSSASRSTCGICKISWRQWRKRIPMLCSCFFEIAGNSLWTHQCWRIQTKPTPRVLSSKSKSLPRMPRQSLRESCGSTRTSQCRSLTSRMPSTRIRARSSHSTLDYKIAMPHNEPDTNLQNGSIDQGQKVQPSNMQWSSSLPRSRDCWRKCRIKRACRKALVKGFAGNRDYR